MKNIFILLVMTQVLFSCLSAEQIAENNRKRIAADDATCTGYGFKPGTDAYGTCRMNLDNQRAQRKAEAWRQLSNSLDEMNRSLTPQTTTCRSSGSIFGNNINSTTTCY